MGWLVALAPIAFLLAGTALAYVFGATAVLWFIGADQAKFLSVLPQRIFSQLDVFALMSMPLFILAGEIMNRGGVTKALIDFSMSIVGRLKGGLGHVNIMTSVFFAGISGSAIADSAALSNTLVPAMRDEGYDPHYAGAITAASAIIGPIIPPSIILIVYGALMQTSVAALFVAGIGPGLLLAAALFALNTLIAHRNNHPGGRHAKVPPFWLSLKMAAPALTLPVIILGGIVFGWTTPTEAAAVAVVAATAVGILYGKIDRQVLWHSLQRAATLTGSIFMILVAIASLGFIASLEKIPQSLAVLVTEAGLSGLEYVFVINAVFLVAGMIMDIPVAMALLVPLLAPVALAQGIDPVHLGIIICFNLSLGLVTPPLGGCLIVVATITKVDYWRLAWATLPFVLAELVVLGVIILVPEISLYLPRLMGFTSS